MPHHPPAGAAILALLALAAPAVGAEGGVTLAASGDAGARLRGRCTLTTDAGERTLEIDEAVPFSRRLDGTGLRCDLDASGRVKVEVTAGGSRSVTSTSGGRLTIAVAG
jgi:hypothetical protein